ncbi:hypothetical protein AXF42_Ash013677 [Apostasia shenzhenica]|uniref:Uncharacterized protein n=1 Tax=Apostasia shenzhenica TaxID=1088818 RepID=A0A2I0APK8_9ASPA|nr:hypothetical protein AXF42_Ash013677 [Apostasia shenzhenica]
MATSSAGCLLVVLFLLCATIESCDATDPPARWVSMLGTRRERSIAFRVCTKALLEYMESWPREWIGEVIDVLSANLRRVGPTEYYMMTFYAKKMIPALGITFKVIISFTYTKPTGSSTLYTGIVSNFQIMMIRGTVEPIEE